MSSGTQATSELTERYVDYNKGGVTDPMTLGG